VLFLFSLLACSGKDVNVGDSGDTADTTDTFPCDADYFPVDFNARRFTYTEYKGKFEQVLSTGARQLEFLNLFDPGGDGTTDTTDTTDTTAEGELAGCVFNQVVPLGYGSSYTVYGIDDDWVYLMADGDYTGGETIFHTIEEPIPLIPLDPVEGWQETIDAEYLHADFEDPQRMVVYASLLELSETITVPGGTYDALKMGWEWQVINGQDRIQLNMDINAWFDKDEGLVRQTWYDEVADSSGLIEFEGY